MFLGILNRIKWLQPKSASYAGPDPYMHFRRRIELAIANRTTEKLPLVVPPEESSGAVAPGNQPVPFRLDGIPDNIPCPHCGKMDCQKFLLFKDLNDENTISCCGKTGFAVTAIDLEKQAETLGFTKFEAISAGMDGWIFCLFERVQPIDAPFVQPGSVALYHEVSGVYQIFPSLAEAEKFVAAEHHGGVGENLQRHAANRRAAGTRKARVQKLGPERKQPALR